MNIPYDTRLTDNAGDPGNYPLPGTWAACEERTGNSFETNCWAHYVDDSGNPVRYCRNFDRTKYYLSYMVTGNAGTEPNS